MSIMNQDFFQINKGPRPTNVPFEADPAHLNRQIVGLWKRLEAVEARVQSGGGNVGARRAMAGSLLGSPMDHLLGLMVKAQVPVLAFDPATEIVTDNVSAVKLGFSHVEGLKMAINAATQGDPTKKIGASLAAGTFLPGAQAMGATLFSVQGGGVVAGAIAYGWRLRVAASQLNATNQPFQVQVGIPVSTAGTITIPSPQFSFTVYPRSAPCDLIVLSVTNGSGQFSVVPGACGSGIANAPTLATQNACSVSAISSSFFASFESLNTRDLFARIGASQRDEFGNRDEFLNRDEFTV